MDFIVTVIFLLLPIEHFLLLITFWTKIINKDCRKIMKCKFVKPLHDVHSAVKVWYPCIMSYVKIKKKRDRIKKLQEFQEIIFVPIVYLFCLWPIFLFFENFFRAPEIFLLGHKLFSWCRKYLTPSKNIFIAAEIFYPWNILNHFCRGGNISFMAKIFSLQWKYFCREKMFARKKYFWRDSHIFMDDFGPFKK